MHACTDIPQLWLLLLLIYTFASTPISGELNKKPQSGDDGRLLPGGGNLPSPSRVSCSQTRHQSLYQWAALAVVSKPVLKVHKHVLRSVDGFEEWLAVRYFAKGILGIMRKVFGSRVSLCLWGRTVRYVAKRFRLANSHKIHRSPRAPWRRRPNASAAELWVCLLHLYRMQRRKLRYFSIALSRK